jgi:tellurite resistance protein TehA-like permease
MYAILFAIILIILYISHYLALTMETQSAIVLFALVAAFGLVTVVAVDIILTAQEAEAQQRGCKNSVAVNASRGRCLH